ncbi:hypothetical protein [Pseudarthrobacter sp. efr-133-R2A-89]|uniref:hypothetical protein n=1 Tax=Pseudarthrobacter sp. efr-133-R2A-89 TaxID=3040302 RepID=UPI0025531A34|nr:hypothetical protein [Pseudarthrobacter sp. efr-133-R2A-89]
MDTNEESIIDWIVATRTAQGLSGTVSLDPALHARTLGAVDRVAAEKARGDATQGSPAA